MADTKTNLFSRVDAVEAELCLALNRRWRQQSVQRFFSGVSRLGDGLFWYALLLVLPLHYGVAGARSALHMGLVALVGVAVYKIVKAKLIRERPFIALPDIFCGCPPLDRYSFPSGHTLHAVSFSILVMHDFPQLGWIVLPFAVLVACSRLILGLHYPTDVLAGGAIGAALAGSSLLLI